MNWRTARGYCWERALRMLGERPAATFIGMAVAALVLALPGFGFMLARPSGRPLPTCQWLN